MRAEPGDLVGMRFIKEGTQEWNLGGFGHNAFGGKAGEAFRSAATGEAKNHILGAVIRLMGEKEARIGLGSRGEETTEKGKAFATGVDFFRLMGALRRLGAPDMQRDCTLGAELAHEGFGLIAILIGESVVEVRGTEGNGCFGTATEERNRISSAAEAEEPGSGTDGRKAHQLRTRVTTRA